MLRILTHAVPYTHPIHIKRRLLHSHTSKNHMNKKPESLNVNGQSNKGKQRIQSYHLLQTESNTYKRLRIFNGHTHTFIYNDNTSKQRETHTHTFTYITTFQHTTPTISSRYRQDTRYVHMLKTISCFVN